MAYPAQPPNLDPQMSRAPKKRKLTDKALPTTLLSHPEYGVDSKMYTDLIEMERKLDWTMMRKKVEVQDALGKTMTTTRNLRIFLSHTVSGQSWQEPDTMGMGSTTEVPVNFDTSAGIPSWQLKIEGRLIEVPGQRARDRPPARKFSSFIRRMVVELDRDPSLYPDGNIVEWHRTLNVQPQDGFTIRRTGDTPTKVRILLHLEHQPEQFKLRTELANVLGIKEESRMAVIQTLWSYIKVQGLQDQRDRRLIKADERLRPMFGADSIMFQQLPELVNRFLLPPDPIILHYTINPAMPPPERPGAWDVDVKMEDTTLKSRMSSIVVSMNSESSRELAKLDEEIALHAQSIHNSHLKLTFLRSFADDPQTFIQKWLESQSRDLETVLGSGPTEGATVRQEELRRSEFFRLPWVEEAVAVQEGLRLAARGLQ